MPGSSMKGLLAYLNNQTYQCSRHYGALQGLDKQETVNKFGKDQVNIWRRSYDIPPPPCDPSSEHHPSNISKYKELPFASKIDTESLKTTLERVLPFWHSDIAPSIKSGKNVVIAAHGNSLRALVKYLDNIPEDVIAELNIPTGAPLVYTLDENLKPIPHRDAIAPLQGRYLGNQEDIRARILGVKVSSIPPLANMYNSSAYNRTRPSDESNGSMIVGGPDCSTSITDVSFIKT